MGRAGIAGINIGRKKERIKKPKKDGVIVKE